MDDNEMINVNDMNYAIYKVGDWKNDYKINQIGLSSEIPVTKSTVIHVKYSMDEIRNSEFSYSDKTVNGFVAIALQLSPDLQDLNPDEVIKMEAEEYENILEELDGLELLDEDSLIPLNGEDYLIYKLERDCHVTKSTPVNEFTRQFYLNEMKKIEEALD